MPELIQFEVVDMPAMKIVGKAIYPSMKMEDNPIPAFWGSCFKDGTFQTLESLDKSAFDGSYVGFLCDYSEEGTFTYIVGIFLQPDCPVPEGYVSRDIAPAAVGVGWVRGSEQEVYPVAHKLTTDAMVAAGRTPNEEAGWCAEVYNCPRFTTPQENGDVILDYYIPCK